MNKPCKTIPYFASEAEERAFWESHDSTDCIDWTKARRERAVADQHFARLEINQAATIKKLLPLTSDPQLDALFAAVAS